MDVVALFDKVVRKPYTDITSLGLSERELEFFNKNSHSLRVELAARYHSTACVDWSYAKKFPDAEMSF